MNNWAEQCILRAMPLSKVRKPTKKNCRANVSKNISRLLDEGREQKQAVAIALDVARRAGCKVGGSRSTAKPKKATASKAKASKAKASQRSRAGASMGRTPVSPEMEAFYRHHHGFSVQRAVSRARAVTALKRMPKLTKERQDAIFNLELTMHQFLAHGQVEEAREIHEAIGDERRGVDTRDWPLPAQVGRSSGRARSRSSGRVRASRPPQRKGR